MHFIIDCSYPVLGKVMPFCCGAHGRLQCRVGAGAVVVQVSLAPSALAADGSGVAAAITAPGGNKAKVKDGEAVFKNVRIEADSPGAYTLRVKSASRKVGVKF